AGLPRRYPAAAALAAAIPVPGSPTHHLPGRPGGPAAHRPGDARRSSGALRAEAGSAAFAPAAEAVRLRLKTWVLKMNHEGHKGHEVFSRLRNPDSLRVLRVPL